MRRDKNLPLTETVYYILLSLLEPSHGYMIMQKIEEISEGQVRMAAGTLYGAIENPNKIIEDYSRYTSYQKGIAKKEITLIWGSMYGMTQKGVEYAIKELEKEDIAVNVHKVLEDSWGTILASVWTSTASISKYNQSIFASCNKVDIRLSPLFCIWYSKRSFVS